MSFCNRFFSSRIFLFSANKKRILAIDQYEQLSQHYTYIVDKWGQSVAGTPDLTRYGNGSLVELPDLLLMRG